MLKYYRNYLNILYFQFIKLGFMIDMCTLRLLEASKFNTICCEDDLIWMFLSNVLPFCSTAPNKRHQIGGSPSVRGPPVQGSNLHRGTVNRATIHGAPGRRPMFNGPASAQGSSQDTSTRNMGGPHNISLFSKFASKFSRRWVYLVANI